MPAHDRAGVARALSYPGIDPRLWAVEAIVEDVIRASDGVYVDVLASVAQQPDGIPMRAKMVRGFAGPGFGVYLPVRVGDLVLVVCPNGDPDGAPKAFGPISNDEDTLPEAALDEPDSIWIVAENDTNVRVKVAGDGVVSLDAPIIELGPDGASKAVAVWPPVKTLLENLLSLITTGLVAGSNPVTVNPTGTPIKGAIEADLDADAGASAHAMTET